MAANRFEKSNIDRFWKLTRQQVEDRRPKKDFQVCILQNLNQTAYYFHNRM